MASGQSRPIDRFLNIVVSLAAVPVLLGALFKITHKANANLWLEIGLYTEAGIFLLYGLLYIISPPPEPTMNVKASISGGATGGSSPLGSMDKMMKDADITPENLSKLSQSFQKLGSTVNNLSDVSNVISNTNDFSNKTKEAANAISNMSSAFQNSAKTMQSFNNASESAQNFQSQLNQFSNNLSQLNTIYENELKQSSGNLQKLNNFYNQLDKTAQTLASSSQDATNTTQQISNLASNLSKLNSVYGNMLNAMQGGGNTSSSNKNSNA